MREPAACVEVRSVTAHGYTVEMPAVLWDLDGTLVDSEQYHWLSWRDTMQAEGIPITHDQFLATFGWRNDVILPRWLGAGASAADIIAIGDRKEELYRSLMRSGGLELLPGAADWIERLAQEGWRQAIASSAPRANIQAVIEVTGLKVDAFVGAEDVQNGKPAPDIFLAAAAAVDTPPEHCTVVEDADAGVEAGRRAGMRTIGVSRNGKARGADLVVASLVELPYDAFRR